MYKDRLDATEHLAIALGRVWPPGSETKANSWFGGLPNLPDSIPWPSNPTSGFALHHIAQIDLSEMPDLNTYLPTTGMLWFFAEIDDILCWDDFYDKVTPGQSQIDFARVIFHPTSTKGKTLRPAPRNLPQISHSEGVSTAQIDTIGLNEATTYHRWPLIGHASKTWEDDSGFRVQTADDIALLEAQEAAETAERARLFGPEIPFPDKAADIFKQQTFSGGAPRPGQKIYDPTAYGDMFPYHCGFAVSLIAQWEYDMRQSWKTRSAEDASLLTELKHLKARLSDLLPHAPLSNSLQTAFDRAMEQLAPDYFTALGVLNEALIEQAAQAVVAPERYGSIPEALRDTTLHDIGPGQEFTKHYLLGSKEPFMREHTKGQIRLAQFDSDRAAGFMFCDCGVVEYWITPDALAAGRFDLAWATTDGG